MFIANQVRKILELRRSDLIDRGEKHFTPTEFLESSRCVSINIALLPEFAVRVYRARNFYGEVKWEKVTERKNKKPHLAPT